MKPKFASQMPASGQRGHILAEAAAIAASEDKGPRFSGANPGQPSAKLKRPRMEMKKSKRIKVFRRHMSASALLVLFTLNIVAGSHQQNHGRQVIRTKWPATASAATATGKGKGVESNTTATGLTPSRHDDISMINERLLPVQDATVAGATAKGERGEGGGKSGWPPVDVDVGDEINQYEDKQIQEAASRARKTQERSKRTAPPTTMATESDGSPRSDLETKSGGEEEAKSLMCRLEKDWYMEFGEYREYACANCYGILPEFLFSKQLLFAKKLNGSLLDKDTGRLVKTNETDLIKATFKEQQAFNKWQQCCSQAIDCCRKNSIYLPKTQNPKTGKLIDDDKMRHICPATWDGFACWPDSPAGQVAKRDCPLHVYFLDFTPICVGQVTKQCFANGSWFVRNAHEWSNFSECNGLQVYEHRMIIGSVLHLFSVTMIAPALYILGKMRKRDGTRRVRILRMLLTWLLLNCLVSAVQKVGIITGLFKRPVDVPSKTVAVASAIIQQEYNSTSQSHGSVQNLTTEANALSGWRSVRMALMVERSNSWMSKLNSSVSKYDNDNTLQGAGRQVVSGGISNPSEARMMLDARASSPIVQARATQSFLLVLFCWAISVGIKITRLFGYTWMATSALYLCSVLHFSPAEPPAWLMKSLIIFTYTFPISVVTCYIAVRSIYDPSPLKLLLQLPYYYVVGDIDKVHYLKDTQLDCWMVSSNSDWIEGIADLPYFILVLLNTFMFVITLVIMCRFKKVPGSSRPETSIWGYFKAAGMLVFLYGAHYLLLAYTPKYEGCTINQVWHYTMLFVDGIQGAAVSIVFCYKTSAGWEVITKWWRSMQEEYGCHNWSGACHSRPKRISRHQKGPLKQSSKSNRSTRSSNSICNGKEMVTELSNANVNNF